jgi:hypothetical protein
LTVEGRTDSQAPVCTHMKILNRPSNSHAFSQRIEFSRFHVESLVEIFPGVSLVRLVRKLDMRTLGYYGLINLSMGYRRSVCDSL